MRVRGRERIRKKIKKGAESCHRIWTDGECPDCGEATDGCGLLFRVCDCVWMIASRAGHLGARVLFISSKIQILSIVAISAQPLNADAQQH